MASKPVFKPFKAMPKSLFRSGTGGSTIIRDQLSLSTWIAMGASAFALVSILLPKSAHYLGACLFALLAYRVGNTILQINGIISNPQMAKVIPGKTSSQIPDLNGNLPTEPSQEGVVVLLLGFKSNHPLRMLAPGFKETADYFMAMIKALDNPEGREQYGFLGISSYIGSQNETSNELMTVSYWRNTEGLHAFAESAIHRKAWDWWNKTAKQHPHLVIFHEIYKAERKSHENIYYNSQPMLIGGTAFPVKSDEKEEQQWVSPIVEANRGVLVTSKGRLGLRGSHS